LGPHILRLQSPKLQQKTTVPTDSCLVPRHREDHSSVLPATVYNF
jgi:hypothetical protein